MPLSPGFRLGVYEILAKLGEGGMGEVYRARDTRLKRDVAIKVLPETVAGEPERIIRFEREAELLATLNHPNIAGIYGFEESPAVTGIVLELVEGPTLSDRIARGPLPLDEALAVATQVIGALEAAHEKEIVHRDLKPANIKLTPAGAVKVLDFGLAKAMESLGAPARIDLTMSPTMVSPTTQAGVILGTPAYMSPEQARGKEVDQRTDIWAFGCLLYEMLTGQLPFAPGETVSDAIAAVLTREPDWNALPADTPASVRRLLRRCLHKDADRRLHHIADARLELADADPEDVHRAISATQSSPLFNRVMPFALVALALATVTLALLYAREMRARSAASTETPAVSRLTIALPESAPLPPTSGGFSRLAISPDGRQIVYLGRGNGDGTGRRLYRRALDRLDVEPIPGSERAANPFFSPDGRTLGFFGPRAVQRVSANGGLPVTIAESPFPPSRGAAWTRDDTIFFGILGGDLWRVGASGGMPALVAGPDALRRDKEITRRYPSPLPDGRTLLYVALPSSATSFANGFNFNAAQIMALDQQTGRTKLLLTGGFAPQYVASGHLVFARQDGLYAVPFDIDTLTLRGEAVKVLSGVATFSGNGFADFAVSANGTLVYAPGADFKDYAAGSTVVWVDRQGRERPLAHWNNAFNQARLSADGLRLVVHGNSATSDIGIHDIVRGVLTRLTDTPSGGAAPVWTFDQKGITYTKPDPAFVAGPYTLVTTAADGSGVERPLLERPVAVAAESWAPDGTALAFTETAAATGTDIWVLPVGGDRVPVPIATTRAVEQHPRFSPDGRWIVYQSNESGQDEIFVRAWPLTGGGKYQVSTGGGANPEWASDREIVYQRGPAMMHVSVNPAGAAFAASPPATLFAFESPRGGQLLGVAPDGRSFVMTSALAAQRPPGGRELVVVQNWGEELKRLVPAR
jgi:serine/threonine-protein kinase